jgi:FKBP-type peptidyl-prolyl cis-trans isomerase FkpA
LNLSSGISETKFMVARCSRTLVRGVAVFMLTFCGCEGLRDPVPASRDPVPTVKPDATPQADPASLNLKPKNAALPKLPPGAGPMDDDAPEELTPTPTGLYYRILRKSEGVKPKPADDVLAHYKGWLDDGKQFDSSYDRGEPTPFPLSSVIAGWTEGLQLIGEGGMIELDIPYERGYGEYGQRPKIPPRAQLHFIVELVKVTKAK